MHRINLLYLLNLAEPKNVQILRGRHPANPRSHANFAVNRVFEKEFEGLKLLVCRSMHRINLFYLLDLAEPQKVLNLRGRHPANPRSHANVQLFLQ